jgi:putative transport protein
MPPWFDELLKTQPVAYAILVYALVIAAGLAVGGVRVRGIGLGSAAVLFVGLLAGQAWPAPDHAMVGFLKDFGLVLFVFTIGLQLGPGFFATFRADGVRLNLLAAAVVLFGSGLAALACVVLDGDPAGPLGVLAGAVTNTPSLGATQQALHQLPGAGARAGIPAIAYAVAYPGGIAGIILSLLLLRRVVGREAVDAESAAWRSGGPAHIPFERRTVRIDVPAIAGLRSADIPGQHGSGVTMSRIRGGDGVVHVVLPATEVHLGDHLLLVGPPGALDAFAPRLGAVVDDDLVAAPGPVSFARVVVTARGALGRHLGDLCFAERYAVAVTRLLRSEVQMPPDPQVRLHFGDVLHIVGEARALEAAAAAVGNQARELDQTHFAAIFLGIALGAAVGLVPVAIPGLPEPLRLGLAGGPLLVAILLGRLGQFGGVVWHMPEIANRTLREFGIALFLASVGLVAGPKFFATAFTPTGGAWALLGLAITMVPLVSVGLGARFLLQMKFGRICGLLAGSMTDPPALAFATGMCGDGPAAAYAAVYPLAMILRIVIAQVLVAALCR